MVKNTSGGSKHKSSARKHANNNYSEFSPDPVPTSPFEKIATVDRMLGNGMCLVITHEPKPLSLICHIRGKFRGKHKSHNLVSNKSTLLIGLRQWEQPHKNCDLLAIISNNNEPNNNEQLNHPQPEPINNLSTTTNTYTNTNTNDNDNLDFWDI